MSSDILTSFGDLDAGQLMELSRVSETAERYDDMCAFTSALVKKRCGEGKDLSVEERNLLSVAFKNVVGAKRASWRTLNGETQENVNASEGLKTYKTKVEDELKQKCEEVLALLKDTLIPNVKGKHNESEVFYLKMCADYYRYMAEFGESTSAGNNAKDMYSKAMEVAKECLNETHPTRLGLALNFSVCYYEILKNPESACALAKEAFDGAISKLDTLNDASYKDSTLIMQLLRDNLTLWTSENNDADEAE
jgi:hypothetical protein